MRRGTGYQISLGLLLAVSAPSLDKMTVKNGLSLLKFKAKFSPAAPAPISPPTQIVA